MANEVKVVGGPNSTANN